MSEKYKNVKIKDYEYQIGKFGARDGAFIAVKVAGILAPLASSFAKGSDELYLSSMIAPLSNISEKDFDYLQEKSLRVCKVKLQAGYINVLNDNGSFALADLEDDAASVMGLMIHALWHNLASFFGENSLLGLVGGLSTTNQQG